MNKTKGWQGEHRAACAADLARHKLVTEEFNCAEATFWGIVEALGISANPALMRVATPFGGGIGDSGSLCGALVGGLLALGVSFGRSELDHARKLLAYERSRQLYEQFVAEAGHDMCRDLNPLGFDRPDLRVFCCRHVMLAARLSASLLETGASERDPEHPVRIETSHSYEETGCTWEA